MNTTRIERGGGRKYVDEAIMYIVCEILRCRRGVPMCYISLLNVCACVCEESRVGDCRQAISMFQKNIYILFTPHLNIQRKYTKKTIIK